MDDKDMYRVIVSFTTLPSRINKVYKMLDSLAEQSYKKFEVHANIPYHSTLENEKYIIPEEWNKYEFLKVYRTKDWGSYTKLYPTLKRIGGYYPVITVDDDIIYHKDLVKEMLKADIRYDSKCALGWCGVWSKKDSRFFVGPTEKDTEVDIIEGYKGALYYKRFFNMSKYRRNIEDYWCDDTVTSLLCKAKKIVCHYKGDTNFEPRVESFPYVKGISMPDSGIKIRVGEVGSRGRLDRSVKATFK